MPNSERPRILCVDDESNVLDGLARTLRSHYVVETATEGKVALDLLRTAEPFAVVMSDQRMPQMTGTQFLAHARAVAPASVRGLLTGQADVESAIAAVNEGNIFRFLTKPCATDVLLKALDAGCEQPVSLTQKRFCSSKPCKAASRPSWIFSRSSTPWLSDAPRGCAKVSNS